MSKKEKKSLRKLAVAAHIVAFVFGIANGAYTTFEHFHRTKAEARQESINQAVVGAVKSIFDNQTQPGEQKQSLHKNQASL